MGVYFTSEQKGWIGSSTGVFKTTDGGLSFVRVTDSLETRIYTVAFADAVHGWALVSAISGDDYIYKTPDGGDTWHKIQMTGTVDLQLLTKNIAHSLGGYGVLKTMDGGSTWSRILKPDGTRGLLEVFFIDENTGWAGDRDGNVYRFHK